MSYSLVHSAHVLVMGYWLGSELVINALTHYVARTTSLSGVERMRLWDFLLAFFAGTGVWSLVTGWPYPTHWLALKVLLFAGGMVCGIFVRYYIREAYRSARSAP